MIVQTGGFSAAADEMSCSQSAISQMIDSLERELGVRLIARHRTGCELTEDGRHLYPLIERLARGGRNLQEESAALRGLMSGMVRIGTIASISAHWLPGLMKDFQRSHPNIEFVLHQGDYTSIQEWIHDDTVDFGFINPAAARNVQTSVIRTGPMIAVLPPEHPLAAMRTVPLRMLAQEAFILLEEGHYSEPIEAFAMAGLTPQVRYRIHDDYSIMTMVEAGLGVSILADLILRRTHYRLELRPTDPPVTRTIAIAYREQASLPAAARAFITHLEHHASQLP